MSEAAPKTTKITVELHDLDERGVPTRATIVVNKLGQYRAGPLSGVSGTDERMSAGGESPILTRICEAIREEHTAVTGIDYLNADGTVCDAMGTPR
jgi:hypothetical protein